MTRTVSWLTTGMLLVAIGCTQDEGADEVDHAMLQQNEALLRQGYAYLSDHNIAEFAELIGPGFVYHGPGGDNDRAAFLELVTAYTTGFPDLTFTVDGQIAEKNLVVTRWTGTGTHSADLPGLPATNRSSTVSGLSMARIVDGKIVEMWESWDEAGMLRQLGVLPN